MGATAEDISPTIGDRAEAADALIDWKQRYEGIVVVAYLDGKAVAGISGPWPVDQYALTWWDRPVPARQMELFDSLDAAQRRVEEWARRMRTIGLADRVPANDPFLPASDAAPSVETASSPRTSWIGRLGALLGKRAEPRSAASRREPVLEMRAITPAPLDDSALVGIHFAAYDD